ncbi:hypothetical protein HAX54_044595, partial [Datura stramonium]|nr:hypothetical protein [Datura stramonium]
TTSTRQDKGKHVSSANTGRKRLHLGAVAPAAPPVAMGQKRRFSTRWVVDEGKKWYVKYKESKYFLEEQIDWESLAQEFPQIQQRINTLGMDFIFNKPRECNLHMVRDFYANWDPTLCIHTIKIQGQVIQFEEHPLNAILGTPDTDPHPLRQLISPCHMLTFGTHYAGSDQQPDGFTTRKNGTIRNCPIQ